MAGTPSYRTADATVSAYDAVAITPSNTTVLRPTRGIYVGTGGNIAVQMALGNTVTLVGVLGGSILPIQVVKVLSTNTTASNMVALY
jgi:hypothetical protein